MQPQLGDLQVEGPTFVVIVGPKTNPTRGVGRVRELDRWAWGHNRSVLMKPVGERGLTLLPCPCLPVDTGGKGPFPNHEQALKDEEERRSKHELDGEAPAYRIPHRAGGRSPVAGGGRARPGGWPPRATTR